jgi:hypothetical protein
MLLVYGELDTSSIVDVDVASTFIISPQIRNRYKKKKGQQQRSNHPLPSPQKYHRQRDSMCEHASALRQIIFDS